MTNLPPHSFDCGKIVTWRSNLLEIFSEISKELPNDIFAEFDGNSRIMNIIERLNLVEFQEDDVRKCSRIAAEITKIYTPIR